MSIDAGHTAFTRTPSAAWSTAIARVSEISAPLLATYAAAPGCAAWACAEETLTIAPPPRSRISGIAALDIRNALVTFTASTSAHSSSLVSTTVP